MTEPATQAAKQMMRISHLPASMNGSAVLYVTTLTAMMCGAVLGLYVLGWMSRDLLRDRKHAGFKSVLFNFRLMMLMVGGAAAMACMPEVLYLQMYGDPKVSETTQALVMTGKRVVDSLRIYVIIGWVGLLTMIYPYVCLALIESETGGLIRHLQVADYPGLNRLWKPAGIFITISIIAMAFAFSKVYAS